MSIKHSSRTSKALVLLACLALLGHGTGCSLGAFGPLAPFVKMGYNSFATLFNSSLFGTGTTTGF